MGRRACARSATQLQGDGRISSHFLKIYYPERTKRRPSRGANRKAVTPVAVFCLIGLVLVPAVLDASVEADVPTCLIKGHQVTVTAYTNVPQCTDSTPNITASAMRIRPRHYGKIVALSPDLAKKYKFGDKFELWLDGKKHVVEYQDLMNKRYSNRIDFLLPSVRKAKKFGVNDGVLIPLDNPQKPHAEKVG